MDQPSNIETSELPLPQKYTVDELKAYIYRKLGFPQWNVELSPAQITDNINDAIVKYGLARPLLKPQALRMSKGNYRYLEGVDVGHGIIQINFVDLLPTPTEIFYGNLISPAPLLRTGIDEYDTFMRWRKMWQRITSVAPDWYYDDFEKVLYIHNPIERYHAGVICAFPYTGTAGLDTIGFEWIKDYSLAVSEYDLANIWSKFSGAIPGPAKDIQLDVARRDRCEKRIDELKTKLFNMQKTASLMTD